MFTINNEQWHISAVHPLNHHLFRSDGSLSVAACDDSTKTIYINGTLDDNFLKKVLCHEITHAAMFSYNVDLSLEQEELVADLIATYGDEIIAITNNVFIRIKERSY